eukprot:m.27877 g.27877  ORF g.27877 m.27877 type:complete len:960 (+) comp15826_c0_seq2:152-3031(+)
MFKWILPDFTKRTMLRNLRRLRWELKDRPIAAVAIVAVLFVTWKLLPLSNTVLTDENRIDDVANWLDDYAGIKLHGAHSDAVREVMARTLVRFSNNRKSTLLGMSNEQLLHIGYTVKELGAGESLQHSAQESMINYSKEQLSPYPRRVWLRDYGHWPQWDKIPVSIPKTESRFAVFVPIAVGDYDRFGTALSQWGKISSVTSSQKHTLPPAVVLAFAGNFSSDEGVLLKATFKRFWKRFVDQDDTGPDLHFLSLNQPKLNHYDGAAMSFYQICEVAQKFFSTIALLEMDMMPVTKDWFSKLATRAENNNCEWWQKGSPSMGDAWGLGEFAVRRDFHLNGNALYAPGCAGFMDYIQRVQRFYPPRAIYKDVGTHCFFVGGCEPGSDTDYNYDAGYDHALYDYRQQPENYVYALNVMSKFVYDKSLMNLGGSSLSSFDFDESTLLVHTKLALLSHPEQIVTEVWRDVLRRDPTVEELKALFPLLNSGEYTRDDVIEQACDRSPTPKQHINICVKSKKRSWAERLPGKTYLWNTDFHSSPVSCNLQIYEAAGAVVHSEVDYGNCIFAGSCKNRMRVLGWDDNLGFALKSHTYSDPELLKLAFYNEFKDTEEFQRVDGFLCSHPVANCELFLKFNKPVIVFATTRLEFGRHDKFIDWRAPDWTQVEGERRWRQWIETLIKISKDPKSTIAANSMYDVKYIEYFTGLKALYLPSWCGDKTDTYWNLCHGKQDPVGNAPATYNPTVGETTVLIGAYRTNLERNRFVTPDDPKQKPQTPDEKFEAHPIIQGLRAAAAKSTKYKFETIAKVYPKGYSTGDLGTHPAIVVIPYQVSTMNLFEMYRVGIPLFFPSLKLLSSWYAKHAIMWERQYGQPERLSDVIGSKTTWPDPNDSSVESFEFWVKWADWYTWPHIQLFDSWEELSSRLNAMKPSDFDQISLNMLRESEKQKLELVQNWTNVFDKMRKH